ncbi:hypothetical protein [Romboutsia ilealis]|uniref:hypothetical protein n=1 Tax=Romboutsia ilealis TaxID=1115758 RepID=UPI0023F238FD|nr:hypothetical protein [Romboutsia ilealis]
MKLPIMLRQTHEEELDRVINIIVEKNRVIAVQSDELAIANRMKATLQDRNASLNEALTIAEGKIKKLEEYVEKLEQVSEKKTIRNCSLNTKLVAKEKELKKLDEANKDLDKANKVLIEGFNSANRSNWCNEESKRQIEKLAYDILDSEKINKNEIASYLLDIVKYMGGGMPIDIKINDDIEK